MRRSLKSVAAAVVFSLALYGCGATDRTTSPQASQRFITPKAGAAATLLGSPKNIVALQRNTPLAAPITVTRTIGILGGTLAVPAAGVTIVVPPLALSSNTTMSVTARAGSELAYDFAPHGLHFNLPLVMTQNLVGTQAAPGGLIDPLNLFVGYYPDSTHTKSVTELLSVSLGLVNTVSITTLWHFSGYIIATGCDDSIGGGDSN